MGLTTVHIRSLELETSPGRVVTVDIGGPLPRSIRHSLEDDISRFPEKVIKGPECGAARR